MEKAKEICKTAFPPAGSGYCCNGKGENPEKLVTEEECKRTNPEKDVMFFEKDKNYSNQVTYHYATPVADFSKAVKPVPPTNYAQACTLYYCCHGVEQRYSYRTNEPKACPSDTVPAPVFKDGVKREFQVACQDVDPPRSANDKIGACCETQGKNAWYVNTLTFKGRYGMNSAECFSLPGSTSNRSFTKSEQMIGEGLSDGESWTTDADAPRNNDGDVKRERKSIVFEPFFFTLAKPAPRADGATSDSAEDSASKGMAERACEAVRLGSSPFTIFPNAGTCCNFNDVIKSKKVKDREECDEMDVEGLMPEEDARMFLKNSYTQPEVVAGEIFPPRETNGSPNKICSELSYLCCRYQSPASDIAGWTPPLKEMLAGPNDPIEVTPEPLIDPTGGMSRLTCFRTPGNTVQEPWKWSDGGNWNNGTFRAACKKLGKERIEPRIPVGDATIVSGYSEQPGNPNESGMCCFKQIGGNTIKGFPTKNAAACTVHGELNRTPEKAHFFARSIIAEDVFTDLDFNPDTALSTNANNNFCNQKYPRPARVRGDADARGTCCVMKANADLSVQVQERDVIEEQTNGADECTFLGKINGTQERPLFMEASEAALIRANLLRPNTAANAVCQDVLRYGLFRFASVVIRGGMGDSPGLCCFKEIDRTIVAQSTDNSDACKTLGKNQLALKTPIFIDQKAVPGAQQPVSICEDAYSLPSFNPAPAATPRPGAIVGGNVGGGGVGGVGTGGQNFLNNSLTGGGIGNGGSGVGGGTFGGAGISGGSGRGGVGGFTNGGNGGTFWGTFGGLGSWPPVIPAPAPRSAASSNASEGTSAESSAASDSEEDEASSSGEENEEPSDSSAEPEEENENNDEAQNGNTNNKDIDENENQQESADTSDVDNESSSSSSSVRTINIFKGQLISNLVGVAPAGAAGVLALTGIGIGVMQWRRRKFLQAKKTMKKRRR